MKPVPSRRLATILAVESKFSSLGQNRMRGLCLIGITLGIAALTTIQTFEMPLPAAPLLGGILIISAIYLELIMLRLFTNSAYYRGLASKTGQGNYSQCGYTYEVVRIMQAKPSDLTGAFLQSTFGTHIYVRAELPNEVLPVWLRSNRTTIPATAMAERTDQATTLTDVVDCILTHDTAFVQFLKQQGITIDSFRGAATLIATTYYNQKRRERWWGRDQLSQRGSLGRSLTLGAWREYVPYTIPLDPIQSSQDEQSHYVTQMSEVLQSRRDSNLIMIAPDTVTCLRLIAALQHSLNSGTALGSINSMSMITIDHDAILATHQTTITIEAAIRSILQAAEKAGNMSIVIAHLREVHNRYLTRGVQFLHILEEFMTASLVHVIIVTTPSEYGHIRNDAITLIKRGHELVIEPLTTEQLISLLIPHLLRYESATNTLMSYGALAAIAEITLTSETPTLEHGVRLLTSVFEHYHREPLITRNQTLAHLGSTLGLPIGPIGDTERDLLLSLETRMQQTIVGQERALEAIASALRRRRANLTDGTKPVASFLFLGPSGVGKTETAKTIAHVYFGGEEKMIRLDMSEYAAYESQSKLLGEGESIGVLEQHLVHHPQGLILLDEFEKADTAVKQLFLQILDEGYVTAGNGRVLNFRAHMIIATSNAGSDLIAKTSHTRALAPILDSDIIAHVIARGLLSAELIGRFSEVILFDALTPTDELTIVEQMLSAIAKKISAQGFALSYEPDVAAAIVERAHDGSFGARPLRHATEQTIEDVVATRIIRGDVRPGDMITIQKRDVTV